MKNKNNIKIYPPILINAVWGYSHYFIRYDNKSYYFWSATLPNFITKECYESFEDVIAEINKREGIV